MIWTEALTLIELICLIPVAGGSIYGILCVAALSRFRPLNVSLSHGPVPQRIAEHDWPKVSILKPVHGMEKDLGINLRSACTLDYPDYQVVFSVQRLDDPAIPLLRQIESEFGPERVTVAIAASEPVVNGKVRNMEIGYRAARHDYIVISDSDVLLTPDYLKVMVAPLLDDTAVGCVCSLYRAVRANRWFERLELLSLNADFTANLIFAKVTGASDFCLGASTALTRATLERIGGLAPLGDYLVEDYEMGRRIRALGLKVALVPYCVDTMVDLNRPEAWWNHQVYWDQNTKAARPVGFAATVLTRSLPFALIIALVNGFSLFGSGLLAGAVTIRVGTAAIILGRGLGDREGLRSLALLPLRDVVGLASWLMALTKRHFVWRGLEFGLTRDGRIVPRQGT